MDRPSKAVAAPAGGEQAGRKRNPVAAAYAGLQEAVRLRESGKPDSAQAICESLIDKMPDYVGALQTLGLIHMEKRSYWQALSCFVKAAMINPDDWTTHTNLASVYAQLGANDLAAQTLEKALKLKPDEPEAHFTLGEVYREEKEYELAAESYQRALRFKADHLGAAACLGQSLSHLGRDAEAAAAFTRVLRLDPQSIKTLYGLSQLPASVIELDILEALEKCRRSPSESAEEFAANVAFVTAMAFHNQGRYGEAWDRLLEANRTEFSGRQRDFRRQLEHIDESIRRALDFAAARKARSQPAGCPVSLFIVGPSRSGKTTIESLMASLPGTKRGYEAQIVETSVRQAFQISGLPTWNKLAELPAALGSVFAEIYLRELGERAAGCALYTNTHPGMIHYIGRLADLVPGIRFVFVKRNLADLALRSLMKKYKTGNHYAYSLAGIHQYIPKYFRLMDIWHEKFPRVSLCLDYEEVVADPEAARARIAALCSLPRPEGPAAPPGNDRGCSMPYRALMAQARGE